VSGKIRVVFVVVFVAALLVPTGALAGSKKSVRATQECVDADLEPAAGNLPRVRAAIVCLHNQVRAQNGLPALRDNGRLRRAALGHSKQMVSDGFFEHTTPGGVTMVDRIMRARYARADQGWEIGENLAWGTGTLSTPRGAVRAWMDSPGHRANILKRSYRELGVGVVLGVPVSDAAGATYSVEFGVRR
jgi:uncharacterized protein YkwD